LFLQYCREDRPFNMRLLCYEFAGIVSRTVISFPHENPIEI
jgi:hypothetical protein